MFASKCASITALVQGEQLKKIHDALDPLGIEIVSADRVKQAVEAAPSVMVFEADSAEQWRGTVRQILDERPEARVVLMSRVADEHMWVEALSAGAHDLLPKPCPAEQFCGTILGALGLYRYGFAA